MPLAVLYDIHGNLPALEAVLAEAELREADRFLIGGDVAWGPMPRATLERLQELGGRALFIRGNADREVARADVSGAPDWIGKVTTWCFEELREDQRAFLDSHDQRLVFDVPGVGDVLFCHGSPRSDTECITPATPAPRLQEMLQDVVQALVFCGHTHMQFEHRLSGVRVVNPGSVGLPYEDEPGAYWALVDDEVELLKTGYDFGGAAETFRHSGCPSSYFADQMLSPTSREEAIEAFEPG